MVRLHTHRLWCDFAWFDRRMPCDSATRFVCLCHSDKGECLLSALHYIEPNLTGVYSYRRRTHAAIHLCFTIYDSWFRNMVEPWRGSQAIEYIICCFCCCCWSFVYAISSLCVAFTGVRFSPFAPGHFVIVCYLCMFLVAERMRDRVVPYQRERLISSLCLHFIDSTYAKCGGMTVASRNILKGKRIYKLSRKIKKNRVHFLSWHPPTSVNRSIGMSQHCRPPFRSTRTIRRKYNRRSPQGASTDEIIHNNYLWTKCLE